ncbi:phosphopantothenoylcysteine decarboxylase subunit VHS3-like [Iris pallida]|uniref:Phosphopantothenoylcysteine decarboxylase subunit VHS3-like n=1 Tax=Iris pallida TaxID=29817 RepID=A0AAX6EHD1_IRIPA|nr:phosphopantothenoylcysteine decarboxylase subunit VHS3-like [Iris pallida]
MEAVCGGRNNGSADLEGVVLSAMAESIVAETVLAAAKSLLALLGAMGSLSSKTDILGKGPEVITGMPVVIAGKSKAEPENKDDGDSEDDDDEDDGDDGEEDQDVDGGDDDSADEGNDNEGDEEDDPEADANGGGGSEDDDDDDEDDGDEDEDDDDEEEEEDEEEDDEDDIPRHQLRRGSEVELDWFILLTRW